MITELHWAIRLFVELIPQKDDDAMALYRWRWKSVGLGLGCLVVALYAANWFPFLSPPYAMANAVEDAKKDLQAKIDQTNTKLDHVAGQTTFIQGQIKEGQIRQLNSDLIDARRYQCRAINTSDRSALPFWNQRTQELKYQYQNLANRDWPEMPCNTF